MGTPENPALPTVWTESHERTAKTPPALVLVHGGGHAGDCWDLTVEELHKQAPEQHVLTVDLPGHGSKPGNFETATIAEWVDSIVADIEAAGLVDIVIVGHSMAGLTVPWSPGSAPVGSAR